MPRSRMLGRASISRRSTSTSEESMTMRIFGQARLAARSLAVLALVGAAFAARAQAPTTSCDAFGIGAVRLAADVPSVRILAVSRETAGSVPYCLVKVLVPQAIN